MGIMECTCDQQWVMHGGVESLYCTSETNTVALTGIKIKT